MTAGFDSLLAELDAWKSEGRTATLWWRDDDAVDATPALDRLLSLSERHAVPVALAVIPANATSGLQGRLAGAATVTVLQHGYAHTNHAPQGERKSEYPSCRSVDVMRREIAEGQRLIRALHGPEPVFVPPWNRYAHSILPLLAELRFRAVSGFGAREDASQLACLNCHADVTAWRTTKGFVGVEKVAERLCADLILRRSNRAREDSPTGLLTHHLVHDDETWAFIDQLFSMTRVHRAVRWIKLDSAIGA